MYLNRKIIASVFLNKIYIFAFEFFKNWIQ